MSIEAFPEDFQASGTQSFRKAIALLRKVTSARGGIGFTELRVETGLPKATLHRLLCGLQAEGLVRLDAQGRRYRAGLGLLEMARTSWDSLDIRRFAQPILASLARDSGETVHIAELDDLDVVYIDKIEGPQTFRMASAIGMRNPAYCTGVGKALLAQLDDDDMARRIERIRFHAFTPNTLRDAPSLRQHLQQVRRQGYALDDEEHETGIRCAAAAVFDHRSEAVAGISVTAPTFRCKAVTYRQLISRVTAAAAEITRACGGADPTRRDCNPDRAFRPGASRT